MNAVNDDEVLMKDSIAHAQSNTAMWLGGTIENRGKLISNNTTIATRELIDNALQEVGEQRPNGGIVNISIDGNTCTATVEDNGRGLPVTVKHHRNGINLTLGTIMASANYENKKIGRTSLNGVGASVTNAISKEFKVVSKTVKGIFEMHYVDGYPVDKDGEYFLKPDADKNHFTTENVDYLSFTNKSDANGETGTFVSAQFKIPEIIVLDRLMASMRGAAKLNPNLRIHLQIKAGPYVSVDEDIDEIIQFPGGFDSLVEDLALPGKATQTIKLKSDAYSANEFKLNAHVAILTEKEYMEGKQPVKRVYVNKIAVDSANFEYIIDDWATRFMKTESPLDNLVEYVVAFEVMTPSFTSQSKHQYSDIKTGIEILHVLNKTQNKLATPENTDFLQRFVKAIGAAKKSLEEQKIAKEAKGKSTAIPGFYSSKKEKELFLTEGYSAIGSIIATRDSETQSAMAFRGTPLNIIANEKHIRVNQEIQSLIRILGGYKSAFKVENCSYEKVIIATDADVDGRGHIAPLMILIFHHLFPGLLESGRVHIADSPLYKMRDGSYSFIGDDPDMSQVVERYKGLGSMRPEILYQTSVNPATRKLIQVQLEHDEKRMLDEVLNNWFNPLAGHVKTLIHDKFGIQE